MMSGLLWMKENLKSISRSGYKMANLNNGFMRCHNCDRYERLENSSDGGITCSEKCSREYLDYLNRECTE